MKLLIKNIKQLVQVRDDINLKWVQGASMATLPCIENAYLLVADDKITAFGKMKECTIDNFDQVIDATNKMVLPAWCDSHSHLVFAGNRATEFVDKINGLTYEQIAAKGGGILNSAKKLNETSEEELLQQALKRCNEIKETGTGAIEIKSGYGLTVESEIKMLRVIKQLKALTPLTIKATFLGAHATPASYKKNKEGYIKLIINEMLPQIAEENFAEFVDVFCELNYFSVTEMEQILEAAKLYNLKPKVHVNQFNSIGAIKAAVNYNALSVDHLEVVTDEDLEALQNSNTMPVALPSCSFFINIPFAPARKIIEAGLPLALASDYNPGSTPSGNMQLVLSLASIKQKLTPNEAINAVTINGAYAMELHNELGSITVGKKANLIITKPIESIAEIPYWFGNNIVEQLILNGKPV